MGVGDEVPLMVKEATDVSVSLGTPAGAVPTIAVSDVIVVMSPT